MQLTFACPDCQQTARLELPEHSTDFECPHCRHAFSPPPESLESGRLNHCLVCRSQELFLRKDFSQKLGVAIVVAGFALSCVTWYLHKPLATYAILFATALIDVVLYLLVGSVLTCYHCHSEYRGLTDMEGHKGFDLEIHEKHRQQAARMKQARHSGS